MELEIGVKN
jgi:hypothetical protein